MNAAPSAAPATSLKPSACPTISPIISGTSPILIATTNSATATYPTAMIGTMISVTDDSRRTPPNTTAAVSRARTTPIANIGHEPSNENCVSIDAAIELACTVGKIKP